MIRSLKIEETSLQYLDCYNVCCKRNKRSEAKKNMVWWVDALLQEIMPLHDPICKFRLARISAGLKFQVGSECGNKIC